MALLISVKQLLIFFIGDTIQDVRDTIADPNPKNIAKAACGVFKPCKAAKKVLKKAFKKCCFVAGTLIDTETGLRPIEEIEIGDKVWARDEATGETALKAVTDLIQRHKRTIWEVTLTGANGEAESFETTDDHPWWIAGQGWKKTEELVAGMAVVTRDGRGMVLASIVETDRTDATYNLTVTDFETYFVGKQRVLVHNCRERKGGGKNDRKISEKKLQQAQGNLKSAQAKRDELKAISNKTPAEKAALKKAEKQVTHAQRELKKSENHAQNNERR